MDGTLLRSDGRISTRNLAALREAEAAGILIVIATGRRHTYAMGALHDLDLLGQHYLVSSNGAVTRTHDSALVHRHHMSLTAARWLCTHASDFRSTLVFTFDTLDAEGRESVGALVLEEASDLHRNIGRWMEANRHAIHTVDALEDVLDEAHQYGPPIQAMMCGPVAQMRAAEARLLEHPGVIPVGAGDEERPDALLTLHRTAYPEKDLSIVDILPAGCSKASAIARIAEQHGIEPADILAVGDNWNDLPMLEFSGQAVVMANGPEDFRAFARKKGWTIGPSNDQDGVAEAIEAALFTSALPARPSM